MGGVKVKKDAIIPVQTTDRETANKIAIAKATRQLELLGGCRDILITIQKRTNKKIGETKK